MPDKTAPILALLIVLVLIYLSNSGKLARIRDLLTAPSEAGSLGTGSNMASPPAPGESQTAIDQINAYLRAHGMAPGTLPPGTIGGGQ
jgi:hypothetical protein